jgi:hypothetical protein
VLESKTKALIMEHISKLKEGHNSVKIHVRDIGFGK